MAKIVQVRRGTTAALSSVTGAEGELFVDTDKETLTVHNNYQAGGFPLLREDLNNLGNNTINISKIAHGSGTAGQAIKINSAANGFEFGVAGKTIQVQKAVYAIRTTLPTTTSTYWAWTPFNSGNYFVKQKADTHLRVQAVMPGHGKHSYPGYFMKMKMTNPGGGTIETYEGCRYYHGGYYAANDIHAEFDRIWTPAELGNGAGNFQCDLGWHSIDGSANRPFNVWNPNATDDARGGQQVSFCYITEFYV